MATDPKLLDRVMKLLALATGTSFVHEAAAARAKAEELIAKHNIVLSSIDRTVFKAFDCRAEFVGAKWEMILAMAIARLCGCAFYWYPKSETRFTFAGTVADLETLKFVYYAVREQRIAGWLDYKAGGGSSSFYSWCFSFAQGVERNIERQVTVHELERRRQAQLWYEQRVEVSHGSDMGIYGRGKSAAGHAAGEAVSLHRGHLSNQLRRIGRS